MLELELKGFILQLINFLVLLWLLNIILFKPLLNLFKRREDHINSSLDSAKTMDRKKEDLLQKTKVYVSEAKNKAKIIFEDLSKNGLTIQKKLVDEARQESSEINIKAKKELEAEVKKTKESLRQDVETFSRQIVEKMVGA
ncbi:MAG: F0F1 ATP synthase subunit B [Thermodesulfovibrionia bacterium]